MSSQNTISANGPVHSPEPDDMNNDPWELLRQEQLRKNELELRVRDLERQLTTQENSTSKPRRQRQPVPEITDEDVRPQILNIAHRFVHMSLLWYKKPSDPSKLVLDEEYDPRDRFQSDHGWIQGQLRDLLDAMPSKFHAELNNERFMNTFINAMQQQRSNASTRVRPQTGTALFRCTDEEYADRGNRFKELIGWKTPDNEPSYYMTFAPILYKDYAGQNDKWKIFRNPILMRTYAALLLGPNSVKKARGTQIFIRDSSHMNMESLWGVTSITPAAIASSAIFARYSGSSDTAFQPIGGVTNLEYERDYRKYLEYLCEGLRMELPWVLEIFREWNETFYPNSPSFPKEISQSRAESSREDCQNVMDELYNQPDENSDEFDESENENPHQLEEPDPDSDGDNDGEEDNTGHLQMSPRPASSPLSDEPTRSPLSQSRTNQPSQPLRQYGKKRNRMNTPDEVEQQENIPPKKRRTGKSVGNQIQTQRKSRQSRNQ